MSYFERRDGAYSQGGYREPAFQDAGRFRGPHFTSGGYGERQPISSKEVPAGVIFGCNNKTMMECMHRSLFGATMAQSNLVSRIVTGTTLFLFNFDTKNLHGIFEATSNGGIDLDRDAFKEHSPAGFPAQVWVRLRHDCTPLHESVFKQAIIENYYRQTKFNFELSLQQVARLGELFQPYPVLLLPVAQPFFAPLVQAPGVDSPTSTDLREVLLQKHSKTPTTPKSSAFARLGGAADEPKRHPQKRALRSEVVKHGEKEQDTGSKRALEVDETNLGSDGKRRKVFERLSLPSNEKSLDGAAAERKEVTAGETREKRSQEGKDAHAGNPLSRGSQPRNMPEVQKRGESQIRGERINLEPALMVDVLTRGAKSDQKGNKNISLKQGENDAPRFRGAAAEAPQAVSRSPLEEGEIARAQSEGRRDGKESGSLRTFSLQKRSRETVKEVSEAEAKRPRRGGDISLAAQKVSDQRRESNGKHEKRSAVGISNHQAQGNRSREKKGGLPPVLPPPPPGPPPKETIAREPQLLQRDCRDMPSGRVDPVWNSKSITTDKQRSTGPLRKTKDRSVSTIGNSLSDRGERRPLTADQREGEQKREIRSGDRNQHRGEYSHRVKEKLRVGNDCQDRPPGEAKARGSNIDPNISVRNETRANSDRQAAKGDVRNREVVSRDANRRREAGKILYEQELQRRRNGRNESARQDQGRVSLQEATRLHEEKRESEGKSKNEGAVVEMNASDRKSKRLPLGVACEKARATRSTAEVERPDVSEGKLRQKQEASLLEKLGVAEQEQRNGSEDESSSELSDFSEDDEDLVFEKENILQAELPLFPKAERLKQEARGKQQGERIGEGARAPEMDNGSALGEGDITLGQKDFASEKFKVVEVQEQSSEILAAPILKEGLQGVEGQLETIQNKGSNVVKDWLTLGPDGMDEGGRKPAAGDQVADPHDATPSAVPLGSKEVEKQVMEDGGKGHSVGAAEVVTPRSGEESREQVAEAGGIKDELGADFLQLDNDLDDSPQEEETPTLANVTPMFLKEGSQ